MLLNLTDASTIVEWLAVYPQRHGALLADWAHGRPEHRGAIMESSRRIEADPFKRRLLEIAQVEERREDGLPVTFDESRHRQPAGKQEVLWLQPNQLDPGMQGVAGSLRDLELHRALRLVLHDDGA